MNQAEISRRFHEFRNWTLSHVYSEPESNLHTTIMNSITEKVQKEFTPTGKMLDVGCGSGYAMSRLTELGNDSEKIGLTLSAEDAEVARARGFQVVEQDMSFTEFENGEFDYLWARHSLEHSAFPLLTLREFYRILKPSGKVYVEMPSPKCDRLLEAYDNHYSIMGLRQWQCLMSRAGFQLVDSGEIKFNITAQKEDGTDWSGVEVYEYYYLSKPA